MTKWNYDATTEKLLSVVHDFGTGRLNLTTSFGYDAAGNVNSVTDPRGFTTTAVFDAKRRLKEVQAPAPFNYLTKFTWDDNSNLIKVERQTDDPLNPWQTTQYAYTDTDKIQTITDPGNHLTNFVYDSKDRLWKVIDAINQVTELSYDTLNRLFTVKDPSSTVVETRTYTNNGLLQTIKDANNNVTTYEMDGFDRLDKRVFPDSSYEQYSYDANSNVLTFRDRAGNTITSTFDSLNRLKTMTPQGMPTRTNTFDLAGRLTKVNTPVVSGDPTTGDYQFFFDTAGRFFKETLPDGKNVIYQLDANGNVTRLTWPDNYFVDYVFDELDRMTDIKLNGSASAALHFLYDPTSRRKQIVYENGAVCSYGYELDDDLSSLVQQFVGSSVSFTHNFDNIGQLIYQLVSDSAYGWEPSADRITTYGAANNLNQYPTVDGIVQSYNANGCLTGDGVWTFGYNTLNQLVSATKPGVSASYLYDPLNRQGQKQVGSAKTRFIYDGVQRIADYDGVSGLLQNRYVYGTGMDEPLVQVAAGGTVTFFHHDRLGSIIARTNSGGAVLDQYKYGPFGFTPALPNTSFGYTGQRYDEETGLYYYKARYYSPILGRFLQPDPIGYADSLNLYEYVGNDPMNFTDPLGLWKQSDGRLTGGVEITAYPNNGLPGGPPDPSLRQIRGNVPHEDDCKKKKDERLKDTGSGPVIDDVSIGSAAGGGGGGGTNPYLAQEKANVDAFKKKVLTAVVTELATSVIPWSKLGKLAGAAGSMWGKAPQPRVQGPFSIIDWGPYKGYAALPQYPGLTRTRAPMEILKGNDYSLASEAKDRVNRWLRKGLNLRGLDIHEQIPVKFGGDPVDPSNKIILPETIHDQVTSYWNGLKHWAEGR